MNQIVTKLPGFTIYTDGLMGLRGERCECCCHSSSFDSYLKGVKGGRIWILTEVLIRTWTLHDSELWTQIFSRMCGNGLILLATCAEVWVDQWRDDLKRQHHKIPVYDNDMWQLFIQITYPNNHFRKNNSQW